MEVLSKMKSLLKRDKATQSNNHRPEVGKKGADNAQPLKADKKHSTTQTVPVVTRTPTLTKDVSVPSIQLSTPQMPQQSEPQNLPPDILSSEILLDVAKHIVNRSGNNALLPGANFITQGETFLVKASVTSLFFRNCRDVFFANKNRIDKDSFSNSVFAKAEVQFKKIKNQFITVTPERKVTIKPLDKENKEKLIGLLMQIRWAARIAHDPTERNKLYCEYHGNYQILKNNWGFKFDEDKEMQLYLEKYAIQIQYTNSSIDNNELLFATSSNIDDLRYDILKKYEKIHDDLKEHENKKTLIIEVLNAIERFKVDAIIDDVAKKIQFLKVINKDVPAPKLINGRMGKTQVEIVVNEFVEQLNQIKLGSTKIKSVQSSIPENEVDFNAVIEEAIKRVTLLKLFPNMQCYLSTAISANDPPLNAVLDDALNKIRQLKLDFGKGGSGVEVGTKNEFQKKMNEYQTQWQCRLMQLSEKTSLQQVVSV